MCSCMYGELMVIDIGVATYLSDCELLLYSSYSKYVNACFAKTMVSITVK